MVFNFLYIVNEFPPVGMQSGIRALEITKRLVKENIYPIILTKNSQENRSYNDFLVPEIPHSLEIYRTRHFELKHRIFHLIDSFFNYAYYLHWIPFAYLKAKQIIKKNKEIKFIYASGPTFDTHIIGYLLKRKFKLPLILEYRDPWSFNPYSEKKAQWLNKKINLLVEKQILKSANIINTVSSALITFLKSKFLFIKNKPMYSIPNGINIQKSYSFNKKQNDPIVLTFTGSLYQKRSIVPFFKVLSFIKKESLINDFKILIKIFGYYEEIYLRRIVKQFNIEDLVYFGGFVSRYDALNEILKADLAIHVGESFNYPTIAFKVWDYIGLKKYFLYIGLNNSFTANFVKKNDIGVIIPLNNLEEASERLQNLFKDIKNNKYKNYIDDQKIERFTWDNRAKKFIVKVINNVLKNT